MGDDKHDIRFRFPGQQITTSTKTHANSITSKVTHPHSLHVKCSLTQWAFSASSSAKLAAQMLHLMIGSTRCSWRMWRKNSIRSKASNRQKKHLIVSLAEEEGPTSALQSLHPPASERPVGGGVLFRGAGAIGRKRFNAGAAAASNGERLFDPSSMVEVAVAVVIGGDI